MVKNSLALGNPLKPPVHRRLALLALVVAALTGRASAQTCGPAVLLAGDPELVAVVGELLGARGIELAPGACPSIRAHLERRGDALVIEVEPLDGPPIERVVAEAKTAATVIESFTRADVGSPLLATHAVPSTTSDELQVRSGPVVLAPAPGAAARGVHVFGAFETSYATDRTSWLGAHVGACIMLGPVCAAARLRIANVATGPGVWKDALDRRSTELLVGLDIPFTFGRMVFSPGFAAGLGQMHTHGATHEMRSETGGMRADVHATLSVPISRHLALDLFGAADLTQETNVEWGPQMVPLPAEPRLIVRMGVGLRYGGL